MDRCGLGAYQLSDRCHSMDVLFEFMPSSQRRIQTQGVKRRKEWNLFSSDESSFGLKLTLNDKTQSCAAVLFRRAGEAG
jgi:hypothetical protein